MESELLDRLRVAEEYGTHQYLSLCQAQNRYTVAEARVARLEAALREIRDYDGPEEYMDDVELALKEIAARAISNTSSDERGSDA